MRECARECVVFVCVAAREQVASLLFVSRWGGCNNSHCALCVCFPLVHRSCFLCAFFCFSYPFTATQCVRLVLVLEKEPSPNTFSCARSLTLRQLLFLLAHSLTLSLAGWAEQTQQLLLLFCRKPTRSNCSSARSLALVLVCLLAGQTAHHHS